MYLIVSAIVFLILMAVCVWRFLNEDTPFDGYRDRNEKLGVFLLGAAIASLVWPMTIPVLITLAAVLFLHKKYGKKPS